MADAMQDVKTLAQLLLRSDELKTGMRFLHGGERESLVSYAQLLSRARGLLGHFQQQGLRAGDPVLLFVEDNRAFIDAFWACQLGGLVPVPLAAGAQSEYLHKLAAVAAKFDAPFLFTQRKLWHRLPGVADRTALFGERVCLVDDIAELERAGAPHPAAPGDTALIQFSSGSTSEPKGVVLSHANLLANIRAIGEAARIGAPDVTLSWMPLSHDMGLVGFHLVPMYHGLDQILMDTGLFVRRPARWLQAAQRHGATLLCSPNFGYQHYLKSVRAEDDALDVSQVRLMFNGAEPVSAPVCRAFAGRLAQHGFDARAFFPVYGLAEASLAVTFPEPGSGVFAMRAAVRDASVGDAVTLDARSEHALEVVCLGHPVANCELRICDDAGRTLPARILGHVQIRGAGVTRGYYRCPECDAAAFVDGWLDTGDLGWLDEQGLFITGRCKEVMFVSGQNWYPQDLEHLLQHNAGIDPGKVALAATRSDDNAEDCLLVFVQHRRDLESFAPTAQRVQAALAEHAGLRAQAVIPVHSLPRTTSGKLQRTRLARDYEDGVFAPALARLRQSAQAAAVTAAAGGVEDQLLDLCRQVFPDRAIQADQNFFELGADSLMLVKIHDEIETRFPGKVEITDLFDYPTIGSLAAYISAKNT